MYRDLNEIKKMHPGRELLTRLEEEGMSQHDLATRTEVTEKHISTIISGKKNISASFAKKLEYALGINAGEWLEKQSKFDCELAEFEESNKITREEIAVLKSLKEVIIYYNELKWIDVDDFDYEIVMKMRKYMGVSNLLSIPKISYDAAYRTQIKKNSNVDPYVMYAWQRTCELLTRDVNINNKLDVELLKKKLPLIKRCMFEKIDKIKDDLSELFAECGIVFNIVRNFVGAPVQGFIKKIESDRIILCITLRGKRADRFWFTLFHEIGHILNEDYKTRFIDVSQIDNEMEAKADTFARQILLNDDEYRNFILKRDFRIERIKSFAKSQGVKPFIVIGRLQKEELLEWGTFENEIEKYEWVTA